MDRGEKVIVVLPAYFAEHTVKNVYARIPRDCVDEIILVDDGSSDRTAEVAASLGVLTFRNERNLGYGGNVKVCLDRALERGAHIVIEVHPDDQYDPAAIPEALRMMAKGYDLVLGSRFMERGEARGHGMPRWKFVSNRVLSGLARVVLREPLTEFHTGFRLYHRRLLERVDYHSNANDYLFSFEIIAQARFIGARIAEVPVTCRYYQGVTQVGFRAGLRYAAGMVGVLARYVSARAGRPSATFRLR
jgi:glycosyltransferase involved in cell wall biosynthesis